MNTDHIRQVINALERVEGTSEAIKKARAELNSAEKAWSSLPVRARNIISIGAFLLGLIVGLVF